MEKHQTKQYKCEKCGEPLDMRGEEVVEYSKRAALHFIECKKCGHMNLVQKRKDLIYTTSRLSKTAAMVT